MAHKFPVRVMLMDDDFYALKWNAALLTRDLRTIVCAEAETPEELVRFAAQVETDAILLDTEYTLTYLPLDVLIARLRAVAPKAAVVCLSLYGDPSAIQAAVLAGASGFLLKGEVRMAIASAVVRACRARFVMTPGVEVALHGKFDDFLREADRLQSWEPHPGLTPSLKESVWLRVVYRMRASLAAQEIGKKPGTVERYVNYAYQILEDDWADDADLGEIDWSDISPEDRAFTLFTQPPRGRR